MNAKTSRHDHRPEDAMNSPFSGPVPPSHRHIYTLLVNEPKRHWTVRSLTDALPANAGIRDGAVRDAVNRLLAHRLLDEVPGQRALTFVLTERGKADLASLLRSTA
jgi:hypothetical protein